MSTRKGKEEESVEKRRKFFSYERTKNKNISFDFHLQVFVLVITKMQIQLYQYQKLPFSSYIFFKLCFFWLLRFHFLCFYFIWQTEKCLVSHLLVHPFTSRHWGLLCNTAVRQDITKIVNSFFVFCFFCKIRVCFHYSLLKMKGCKFINRKNPFGQKVQTATL